MQKNSNKKETIVVAMSGGVDSSVVAALLKEQGHDVIGITLQIWQENQRDPRHAGCCSLGAVEDARRVARILDIPHYVLNFKDEFRRSVIDDFIDEYSRGRTPNPCVQCNRRVKFDALFQTMNELGCKKLATGHYARIHFDKTTMKYQLWRAKGLKKDQSYVLYMLNQEQLSKLYFPLGDLLDKEETRLIAKKYNLPVALKPDSQEICFVSEAGGYTEFLKKERPDLFEKGKIYHESGEELGEHDGIQGFTVGQRRGIGISMGRPLYVLELKPRENKVVVGESNSLLKSEVSIENTSWSSISSDETPLEVMAKVRYNMDPKPAILYGGEFPRIIFNEPIRAVTPGQIAVAYIGERVAAGGVIV